MADEGSRQLWSHAQVYGLASVCLVLGIVAGYLSHAPSNRGVLSSQPGGRVQQRVTEAAGARVTPEDVNRMADKKAEPLLAKLAQNPDDPVVLAELGKTYLYARQFLKAADYFERSAKIKPDPRVLTTLGGAYHFAAEDDKALDAWKRALDIDPNYADALYNFGLVKWESQSDPKTAIVLWEKLLKTNPNHPQREQVQRMIARAKRHLNIPPGAKTDKSAM